MLQKKKSFQERSASAFYNLSPHPCFLSVPYLILYLNRKLVNFNFKWIFENLNFWFSDHREFELDDIPAPLSSKYEMFIFGLHSTSDDWPSDMSNESLPKCKKGPPKSSKNEMLIFGLHSTSDDRPSNPSNES